MRKSKICSVRIGRLYHNASLMWYNKRRAFIINQNALHIRLPLANSAHIGKLYHNLAIMV